MVRVVMILGAPWFVAVDVLRALGLSWYAGASQWMYNLNDDEKRCENKTSLSLCQVQVHGRNWNPKLWLISESGLYKIIMRSDKPQAKRFQDWVTREVLPAIRKDGAYVMGEEKVKTYVVCEVCWDE